MGTHMKTTIDIADELHGAAKKLASIEGTTVRALVEAGLRRVISERGRKAAPYRLRSASFKGKGLQPGVDGLSWERVRALAYEGHGA